MLPLLRSLGLTVAAVGVCCGGAAAQDQGAGPGRRRPYSWIGGPEASRILMLAEYPTVHGDLGLDADSTARVQKVIDSCREQMMAEMEMAGFSARRGSATPAEVREMSERRREINKKLNEKFVPQLKETLTASQFARLQQIVWQAAGIQSLAEPEIVMTLELTNEQQEKIAAINQEYATKDFEILRASARAVRRGEAPSDGQTTPTKSQELKREYGAKATEVLSSEQKEKYAELKGKPFDLARLRRTRSEGGDREAAPEEEQTEKRLLTGTVVGPDGAPVGDALVRALYLGSGDGAADPIKLTTNAAGEFRLERKPILLWFYATSPDSALAGQARAEGNDDSVTVKLVPAGTIVGRLIENDAPVPGQQVVCNLLVPLVSLPPDRPNGIPPNGTRGRAFKAATSITETDGRFACSGLLVGERYEVYVEAGENRASVGPGGTTVRRHPTLSMLVLPAPRKVDLGYLQFPAPWRVMLTPNGTQQEIEAGELATRRFYVLSELQTRISTAEADAKREHRRVMLVVGDATSQSSQTVVAFLEGLDLAYGAGWPGMRFVARALRENLAEGEEITDEEISANFAKPLAGFQRLCVNVKDPGATDYLMTKYKIDVAKLALPVLVILGEDGSPAELQSFALAGELPKLDHSVLRGFLKHHAPPPQDAAELLKAAARRARDENKRILLIQTGPGSYPCHLLARFIDQHRELLDRDYEFVNLDSYRSPSGDEVMKQFREKVTGPLATGPRPGVGGRNALTSSTKAPGAVPWMAVLNTDGVKLADSDSPDGNVGFPSEPEGIDYFIDKMLKPTAQRLTAAQLEELRHALRGK